MRSPLFSALLLFVPSLAWAWPADADWLPVTRAGGNPLTDVVSDHDRAVPGLDASADIYGETLAPAAFWYADTTTFYLRLRLNASPSPNGLTFNSLAWGAFFDSDGDTSDWEYMLGVTSFDTLALSANINGTPGVDVPADFPVWSDPTAMLNGNARVGVADTSASLDPDYFLDMQVPFSVLTAAIGEGPWLLAFATGDTAGLDRLDADTAGWADSQDLGVLQDIFSDAIFVDEDGDGVPYSEELLMGTNPADADSDDDGLADGDEFLSDPLLCDSDGDLLPDGLELGVVAPLSDTDINLCFLPDLDPTTTTMPNVADTDASGWWDGWEDLDRDGTVGAWETDPNLVGDDPNNDIDNVVDALESRCDASITDVAVDVDADDDGLVNTVEGFVDTNLDMFPDIFVPLSDIDADSFPDFCDNDDDNDGLLSIEEGTVDTDGDGLLDAYDTDADNDGFLDTDEGLGDIDGDRVANFQDALDGDGPLADSDGDGLDNQTEGACGSNPAMEDSDLDGIVDGLEDCKTDLDCDGLPDRLDAYDDQLCGEHPSANDDTACGGSDKVLDCGHFTGGSCSVVEGPVALFPLGLAAGFLLLRRKKRLGMMLGAGLLLSSPARAYELDMDVQNFHPGYDSASFFSRPDSISQKGLSAGLTASYALNPLVYRYDDPSRADLSVLGNIWATDLSAAWGLGRLRLQLGVPLYLYSGGDVISGATRMGDMQVGAHGVLVDRKTAGWGLGADLMLSLPTGAEKGGLGAVGAGFTGDVTASYGKDWLASASLGLGTGSQVSLPPDIYDGMRVRWGAGFSYPLVDHLRGVGELEGELNLGALGSGVALPAEWRVGVIMAPVPKLAVQAALGTGLGQGLGNPDLRALLSVAWVPAAEKHIKTVVSGNDLDKDGILSPQDLCPDQAEDMNGVQDSDGCPDAGLTPTILRVRDPWGNLVAGASLSLVAGPETGAWTLGDGQLSRSLTPGSYQIRVQARGFAPLEAELKVPNAIHYEQRLDVQVVEGQGSLAIEVLDSLGRPVVASVAVMASDRSFTTGADGKVQGQLDAGVNDLRIWAEGYRAQIQRIEISAGQLTSLQIKLEPSIAVLVGDEVRINEKIFFALNSAEIDPRSRVVLADLADLLQDHPEITLLEIQGHTDDQGADSYNLELSQRRAEAVLAYLVDVHHIDIARLVARGYGESRPLAQGNTDEAREQNRRVVFMVIERNGKRVGKSPPPDRSAPR